VTADIVGLLVAVYNTCCGVTVYFEGDFYRPLLLLLL